MEIILPTLYSVSFYDNQKNGFNYDIEYNIHCNKSMQKKQTHQMQIMQI